MSVLSLTAREQFIERVKNSRRLLTVSAPHWEMRAGQRQTMSLTTQRTYVQDYRLQADPAGAEGSPVWVPVIGQLTDEVCIDVQADIEAGEIVFRRLGCKVVRAELISCSATFAIGDAQQTLTWAEPIVRTVASTVEHPCEIRVKPGESIVLPLSRSVDRGCPTLRAFVRSRDVREQYEPGPRRWSVAAEFVVLVGATIVEESDAQEEAAPTQPG